VVPRRDRLAARVVNGGGSGQPRDRRDGDSAPRTKEDISHRATSPIARLKAARRAGPGLIRWPAAAVNDALCRLNSAAVREWFAMNCPSQFHAQNAQNVLQVSADEELAVVFTIVNK
jgi:hypothetical protein